MPLTRIYLQYGEVDRAVELMEDFVARNPHNEQALYQLGRYFQYAQQPHAYIRNLEVLAALSPSEERLRELSDSYNFLGIHDKQVKVLKTLIEIVHESTPDRWMRAV